MYEDNKKKGGGKKKGPAESKEQEKKDLLNDMPVDEVAGASKGKKHHKKDPKKPVARKKGGAQYKEEGGADHHKGGGKKKGAAGFNSHTSDTHKHPHPEGPSRMGFTQNFGPARQNSYAKGAAKVAKIMGKGAGQMMMDEKVAKKDKALDKRTSEIYGGKKGSTNILGKTMPGFNFFPPENPGNPDDMQSGKTIKRNHSKRGKPDFASAVYDVNQDGDSFFHDKNQDGTMLGRGIKSAIDYLKK